MAIWFSLILMDRRAVDPHFARRRTIDAGDHVDEGALAAPGFSYDADKFARMICRSTAFQRVKVAGCTRVELIHPAQVDHQEATGAL